MGQLKPRSAAGPSQVGPATHAAAGPVRCGCEPLDATGTTGPALRARHAVLRSQTHHRTAWFTECGKNFASRRHFRRNHICSRDLYTSRFRRPGPAFPAVGANIMVRTGGCRQPLDTFSPTFAGRFGARHPAEHARILRLTGCRGGIAGSSGPLAAIAASGRVARIDPACRPPGRRFY